MSNEKLIILHSVTNEENNSFVGLRINNEEIHFHYPESYDLCEILKYCDYKNGCYYLALSKVSDIKTKKDFRNDIVSVIRTISLAKSKSAPNNPADGGLSTSEQFAIVSYLWIIKDYLANGYYRNSEKIYRTNSKGKVNWKKTLETQPIISNGNIIYNNVVVEVRNDCDDIITDAHKWCVFESVRKIGWLFGISEKSVYIPRITDTAIKKYIRAIKTESMRTFDDVKKIRLNHMLKTLTGVDDSDRTKEIVYGVDKYHYVYERMVDYVFSNVSDISKYNPIASWYLKKNNYEPSKASDLRPDTMRLEPVKERVDGAKVAYILDAKFYRFGMTGNVDDLPSTTSIQKQITYGDNVIQNMKKEEKIEHVFNAFVLPYNKNNNTLSCTENLEYIGYSEAKWRDDKLSHNCICTFLIDTKHLISTWSRGNCKEDIAKLIDEIDKATANK